MEGVGKEYLNEEEFLSNTRWEKNMATQFPSHEWDFQGFTSEVELLPVYDGLRSGMIALCLDEDRDIYVYHLKSRKWFRI